MQRFEQDGIVYEELGDGTVRVVGYAQQPQAAPRAPMGVTVGTPNAAKAREQELELQLKQQQIARGQADAATLPYDVQKARADATKAQIDAIAAQAKSDRVNSPLNRLNEMAKADNVIAKINEARALIRKGNTVGWASYLNNLPETDALALSGAFDTIQANLAFDRLQQMRDQSPTGGAVGSVTERELALLGSTVASLNQKQDANTLLNNLDKIENHYRRFQAGLAGIDPNTEEGRKAISQAFGPAPGQEQDRPQGPLGKPVLGIEERFATEFDKRFGAMAQAAFDRGATKAELNELNQKYGYPAYNQSQLDAAIRYRDKGGRGAVLSAPQSGYNDPGIVQRAIQSIGASPLGTFVSQAGNALAGGLYDEVRGVTQGDTLSEAWNNTGPNTLEANLQKQLQSEANPLSAVAGNLTGGALAAYGAGGLTGAGRAAGTFAPGALAGDALFGATYGLGESNDNRLGGAALGGFAGIGGGVLGRAATRKVGQAIGGVGGPAELLREYGVRLTPGQIGESSGGFLGRMMKRREDRLAGFSGIGDAIGQRQREGLQDFNQAFMRDVVEPIRSEVPPGIAEEGIQNAQDMISSFYDRTLGGRTFNVADDQFVSDLGSALQGARELPAIGDQAAYSLRRGIEPFIDDSGIMTGRGFQQSRQELTRRASRFDNTTDAVGPDAAEILRQGSDAVEGMVRRQAPEVVDDLNAANAAYRRLQIASDAVGRAINNEGIVTPAQLGLAARDNAKKFGGRFATPDRPFFDLQRAGQQVLPSKVPDSGTAGRQAAGDGIIGLARSAARNARLPLYSEPGMSIVETLLLARPEGARRLGGTIRNNARVGGIFGAPLALDYAY